MEPKTLVVKTPLCKSGERPVRARPMSVRGQKAKYSLREDVFGFSPESGLKSDIAGGPVRAKRRHRRLGMI
jgi:hypothetical protein